MYNTSFIKKILLAATVVFLYSCDKDFNAIGDDLIGDDHFGLEPEKYDVIAYNQEVTPIQSNSLTINALGIYDNPVFGTTTANYNTQVSLDSYAPSIGETPVVESAVLSIPYFSHITSTNTDGTHVYQLDSIYGAPTGKLKLSVYESGYQMRSNYYENNNQFPQLYYNDQSEFEGAKKPYAVTGKPLNDGGVLENSEFFFDSKEIADVTKDKDNKDVTTLVAPEMRLNLNKQFFQEKILNAAKEKLSAADVFQEYFKGLYFKVEKSGGSLSNMALMDFSKGKITIKYKAKTDVTTDGDATEDRSVVINLTGNNVSLFQDVKNADYETAIKSPNKADGDESLYLKGGQGSVAVIELFGRTDLISYDDNGNIKNEPNGVPDGLDEIRNNFKFKNWRVNEANLVFHIDAAKMSAKGTDNLQAKEPKRVYLYDLTNNVPLLDYSADGSSSVTNDPKMSKVIYGGIISVDETTKRGTTYKFRITNHLRNLLKTATAANVKLGIVVTDDISIVTSNKLKNRVLLNPAVEPNVYFSEAPRASVMNPLGTILYGGKSSVPEANRLRLEVYYTKPNK
ncbi:hypothetical protein J2Y38_004377 [Flavobacterium sp. 2755]|uniref:DUF4270 domain-containing protein n=1 Tax=Flavobacterium sp. 2755 TaxID=2817765 RepID=UPI0028570250|nr:DUF4270 domain-containing protein [Flavobacterium sp. 2755]MDR6764148.1 hypothetical protein [Flavobacterium sp. 2755]